MRRTVLSSAFLLIVALGTSFLSGAPQPAIEIGDSQIVATGLTPGGSRT